MSFRTRLSSIVASFRLAKMRRKVRASFDSAQTNDGNKNHWAAADFLSPNASLLPAVRKVVRSRSLYEIANNTYAHGIVATLCDYIVGTGARLQMTTDDDGMNQLIEKKYREWADAIGLDLKLQTIQKTMIGSGEAFALLTTNPVLQTETKLDIRLLEADQIADPLFTAILDPDYIDGIQSDKYGNPSFYRVLKQHPGERLRIFGEKFDDIAAEHMLHLFEVDRPGQKRGMPLLTAALPLFAQLRRYTLAVLSAAESAALPAGIIHTDGPADEDDDGIEPMDVINMERSTFMTLPSGWKMSQFKAEQPTSTYAEFKREVLNEIARVVGMPFNIAAANSSDYNYASGRLDHQTFFKSIVVRQKRMTESILDPLFYAWLREMKLVSGALPLRIREMGATISHRWFWDGQEHVDPKKEGEAQQIRLLNHTTTLAAEYSKIGKDWETELKQRAKELELMTKLGLTMPEAAPNGKDSDDDGMDS